LCSLIFKHEVPSPHFIAPPSSEELIKNLKDDGTFSFFGFLILC
jgi:hypothetical protein